MWLYHRTHTFGKGAAALLGKKGSQRMSQQEEQRLRAASNETGDTGDEATRADEQGDVAEPDAPTEQEENAGMSTVLDAGPGAGVQTDESDG
jgi:hypothetical protein